jgi:hypothetical protein
MASDKSIGKLSQVRMDLAAFRDSHWTPRRQQAASLGQVRHFL